MVFLLYSEQNKNKPPLAVFGQKGVLWCIWWRSLCHQVCHLKLLVCDPIQQREYLAAGNRIIEISLFDFYTLGDQAVIILLCPVLGGLLRLGRGVLLRVVLRLVVGQAEGVHNTLCIRDAERLLLGERVGLRSVRLRVHKHALADDSRRNRFANERIVVAARALTGLDAAAVLADLEHLLLNVLREHLACAAVDRVEHLETVAAARVVVHVDRQIGRVGVALRDLLHDGVVLVPRTAHLDIHAVGDEEIAARERHLQIGVSLLNVADRAGVAAAVTDTDKHLLLTHGVILLLLTSKAY